MRWRYQREVVVYAVLLLASMLLVAMHSRVLPPGRGNATVAISTDQDPRNATSKAKNPKLNRGQSWSLPELKSTEDVGSLWDGDGPAYDLSPEGADY
jgi:hypothetical protein